jgi:hypothetical protein
MNTTEVLSKLPDKIRNNLPVEVKNDCIEVIKTTYKPSPSIPTLWLIMYKGGFVCCSTNKNHCVYKRLSFEEIDSVRLVKGSHPQFSSSQIEFIFRDLSSDDFMVTVPPDTDFKKFSGILQSNGYQVI